MLEVSHGRSGPLALRGYSVRFLRLVRLGFVGALRRPVELERVATIVAGRFDGPFDGVAFEFAAILHHVLFATEVAYYVERDQIVLERRIADRGIAKLVRVRTGEFAVLRLKLERGFDVAVRRMGRPFPRARRIGGECHGKGSEGKKQTGETQSFHGRIFLVLPFNGESRRSAGSLSSVARRRKPISSSCAAR